MRAHSYGNGVAAATMISSYATSSNNAQVILQASNGSLAGTLTLSQSGSVVISGGLSVVGSLDTSTGDLALKRAGSTKVTLSSTGASVTGDLSISGGLSASASAGSLGSWSSLSFASGWGNYGSGYQSVQYRRFGDRVMVRGMAASTGTSATIGTLPSGYRPTSGRLIFMLAADPAGASAQGSYRVDVDTSGNITVVGWTVASGDWVSLDFSFNVS